MNSLSLHEQTMVSAGAVMVRVTLETRLSNAVPDPFIDSFKINGDITTEALSNAITSSYCKSLGLWDWVHQCFNTQKSKVYPVDATIVHV